MEDIDNNNSSANNAEEREGRASLGELLASSGAFLPALLAALCAGIAIWKTVELFLP